MSDICEALVTLLQDVVLPNVSADCPSRSSAERALKASVVKSVIRSLLDHHEPEI